MTRADTIELDVPARLTYLHLLGSCIQGTLERVDGLTDAQTVTYNVQLAVQEIGANIVTHAYAGDSEGRITMTLTLDAEGAQLVIDLRDRGQRFDLDAVPEPALGELQEHGFGLFLVRELMDSVTYASGPDGNHWRLVKHLEIGGASCVSA